uniref:Rho guanine nucleotide exchange factor (GEF) 11 n=1 Tax=Echeneis naucrates TaxID=173247 RepID=A0A665WVN7_ECHNA
MSGIVLYLVSSSSLIFRLSSLTIGDSDRKSSATHQREPTTDIPAETAGPGLVQRCVVVQKDQLGFGFTVCGERVKLVQNVRPGGAAVKAGVQEGDRIIKVNGSLVSSMSHQEVVKLIKSLTLQGPPPSAASLPLDNPSQRITGPKPLQDPEVQKHASQILRKMLEQEEAELQDLMEELLRNPSPSLEERIESAKRRAHQVRVKIQQDLVRKYWLSHLCADSICSLQTVNSLLSSHFQMDGPFQDIELLKSRPAHMTVFMRYVFTQLLDPNPLLFYLSVEAYLGSSPKDARALAPQICSHYLDPDALIFTSPACSFVFHRNKQMMGLGSLFGEGDLQHLDGDPVKERQVVDRQVTALWEILRLLLFLLQLERGKQMTLQFLSPQLSGTKKEKDGEDKKRNPILKYIGKPRSTSQSIRPGSVRNIIQQFENHTETTGEEGGDAADAQRLSSSSLGEDSMESPMVSVRLARSESLKAQGEGRRRGTESVPRSRSDVDMEDCGEEREGPGLRPLQHSASSSASSSSARSLENPTPPYTPRSRPYLLTCTSSSSELFTTEASHLRTLRVLDQVFFQKMRSVLNSDELACIFPNLHQVYELHASLCEAMKKRRETPIVQDIGDVMLARFEGASGDEFQEHASQLCSQQSQALELIKNKQRKDPRFAHLIQECEASPHCRRLQLKDLLVSEMQRVTKYPLLLDNIIKHTEAGSSDLPSLQRAQACCRRILQAVNEVVRETEHRQRLSQYQRRLDAAPQFKSLDLTAKRMIHEGPLTWKVSKDKQIEIQALLLSDCLVLLQRGPDDRLQLRYPSRWLGGGGGVSGDSKTSFSPLVKLDSLLVRPVATGTSTASFGDSITDDLADPPTPTASHFPQPLEKVSSAQTQPEEETPACESEATRLLQEERMGQSQAGHQSHVIKNVDEIFHTIEGLMSKLRQLKEIEAAHQKLLKNLTEPPVNQESGDQKCRSAAVSRTPSLDRGSGDGEQENHFRIKATTDSAGSVFQLLQPVFPLNPFRQRRKSSGTQNSVNWILMSFWSGSSLSTPLCTLAAPPPFAPRPCMHRPAEQNLRTVAVFVFPVGLVRISEVNATSDFYQSMRRSPGQVREKCAKGKKQKQKAEDKSTNKEKRKGWRTKLDICEGK